MTVEFSPSQALPFVSALSRATSTRAIYPTRHPKVIEALAELDKTRAESLEPIHGEDIQLVSLEGELILDSRPIASSQLLFKAFIRGMHQLGIESLTLGAGLDRQECEQLVDGLSGAAPLAPSNHVTIGHLQLSTTETENSAQSELTEADLEVGEKAYLRLREDPRIAASQLEHFVWTLMRKVPQTDRRLLLIPPGSDPLRALFHHSLNVALLTLAQASSLGIHGQACHDLGFAALLHDVGKLLLPAALLERCDRLSDRDWQVAKLHPELGAALLCGLPPVPEIAVQVAYEHHWRYDGRPSFPTPSTPRTASFASQLTAIADSYDALVAARALAGGPGNQIALSVWQGRSGSYLDPTLVRHFMDAVLPQGSEG